MCELADVGDQAARRRRARTRVVGERRVRRSVLLRTRGFPGERYGAPRQPTAPPEPPPPTGTRARP